MTIQISALQKPEILIEINNSAVPEVNVLDLPKARWLAANSVLSRVASLDGQTAGVIIVLSDNAAFDSDYYRWFTERYRNFIYIDRVIVLAEARGRGVATQLYREAARLARQKRLAIATEVYSDPPNVPSLKFHRKMGYEEVGTQFCQAEGKTVSKLMKYKENSIRRKKE